MRTRLTELMEMNETDLRAMRFLLAHRRYSAPVTAGALAEHLGVTTAATAKLIQRLGRAGHVEVSQNPSDHRSTYVSATAAADAMVEQTLSLMHKRMYDVVRARSESERQVVSEFLDDLFEVMEGSLRA